jgi:outer membrane protein OmpA-like peptidoglycan-associated protein
MAAGCKKCDPHELCEECPEWIFTLADLIMCMMGLFVILWVLKPGGKPAAGSEAEQKLNETVGAIREGFGYIPDPDSTDPIDLLLLDKLQRRLKQNGPGEKGNTKVEQQGATGTDDEVTTIRPGSLATVGGKLLFNQGEAKLTREILSPLDEIVSKVRGHRNVVYVRGHASLDDLPGSTPQQRMLLSVQRAQAVADYLVSQGVSPDTLRVIGCSTFEPVNQRAYSADRQAANRRVEIEVTEKLVEEFQDQNKQVSAAVQIPTASAAD